MLNTFEMKRSLLSMTVFLAILNLIQAHSVDNDDAIWVVYYSTIEFAETRLSETFCRVNTGILRD